MYVFISMRIVDLKRNKNTYEVESKVLQRIYHGWGTAPTKS